MCLYFWIGDSSTWISRDNVRESNAGLFVGAVVCGLASLVLGFLGSRQRIVIEF
jgi:hypothetical protein